MEFGVVSTLFSNQWRNVLPFNSRTDEGQGSSGHKALCKIRLGVQNLTLQGGHNILRYATVSKGSQSFQAVAYTKGNRDYTGMWVRRGSTNLMAGKVVFLRGLLSPIRVVDLMIMNP
ncbi:hypothetical protein TNCV_4854791 [Trichonephila clavipes]|nr:hypothetical protein TNCV_4854791 [Trichonephila clavipes]